MWLTNCHLLCGCKLTFSNSVYSWYLMFEYTAQMHYTRWVHKLYNTDPKSKHSFYMFMPYNSALYLCKSNQQSVGLWSRDTADLQLWIDIDVDCSRKCLKTPEHWVSSVIYRDKQKLQQQWDHICSWATTTFHSELNMRHDVDMQQSLRQSIHSCGTQTMKQSSFAPERRRLIVQWILAVVRHFCLDSEATRSVNYFNCAVRNNLT